MKHLKFILPLIYFFVVYPTLAQSNPTVEIVLSQTTAHTGEMVTANVYIRNAVNVGGADIGITVDEGCLRIVSVENGTFLPTSAENGGYSPFYEVHNHDTRLAAAITDRAKLATGEGIFFSAQLEVICASGTAPLQVSFAELSAYQNPASETIDLIAYTLGAGTVTIINTQLEIVSDGNAAVGATSAPSETAVAPATTSSSENAVATLVNTPSASGDAANSGQSATGIIILPFLCIGILLLVGVFWFMRRPVREEEDSEAEV